MTVFQLKQHLRQNLSEQQWQNLSQLKAKLNPRSLKFSAAPLVGFVVNLLTTNEALSIKEHIKLAGKLDYPNSEILMNLDSLLQATRLNACKKEPETIKWLEENIRPGDVFYDIGANVGAYSFVANAVAFSQCTIYAFEPSFSTFAALSQNILLNKCHNTVIPVNMALSSKTELIAFSYSDITPGASLHNLDKHETKECEKATKLNPQLSALSYRLDDLVVQFKFKLPNCIKIDVDGSELEVLYGANDILESPGLRTLLVEVDEKISFSNEIFQFMESKGFMLHAKYPRGQADTFNCIWLNSTSG